MRSIDAFRRLVFVTLVSAGLTACASPMAPQFPELTYTHLPTITLGVASIEVVDLTTQSGTGTHVEDRMPVAPKRALQNWARDRLKAGGVSGVAKFIIEDASVVETDLKRSSGLKGVFTTEQAERYVAKVHVSIKLEGVPRVSQAYAEARVDRSQTVGEDATINVRDQAMFDLTEAVMKDFDPVMAASIRQHLADFVY